MQKTTLLDFHGVIYFHDETLNLFDSDACWDKEVLKLQNLGDTRDELDIECELVLAGKLPIYFAYDAFNKMVKLLKNSTLVTASSSRVKEQKFVLSKLLGDNVDLNSIVFNDFSDFGSKSDYKAWEKLLRKYTNVNELYEDKEEYRNSAKKALSNLKASKAVCLSSL